MIDAFNWTVFRGTPGAIGCTCRRPRERSLVSKEGSAERVEAGEGAPDRELVDLGRPLVGEDGLEVCRVADDGVFERDPVRAEDRSCLAGDRDRLAGVVELSDAHLHRPELALFLQPSE